MAKTIILAIGEAGLEFTDRSMAVNDIQKTIIKHAKTTSSIVVSDRGTIIYTPTGVGKEVITELVLS